MVITTWERGVVQQARATRFVHRAGLRREPERRRRTRRAEPPGRAVLELARAWAWAGLLGG